MSQDLVNIVIGVAGTAMGWMLKVVWDSIRLLQNDMKVLERALHTKYVSKDDYRTDIQEIKEMVKAIFERLDRKADK
ncbi:MAG: hypothetical protein RJA36_2913 [Pseudomonadota bacterium]|jgi:hypothetical protein